MSENIQSHSARPVERREAVLRARLIEAVDRCRFVLIEEHATLDHERDSDAVRKSIATLADFANHEEVPPERLLAVFKGMVQQLPPVAGRTVDVRNAITRRIVHMLIEAYFPAEVRPSKPRS